MTPSAAPARSPRRAALRLPRCAAACALALAASYALPALAADNNKALIGQYGFDWLKPNDSKCQRLDEKLVKSFLACKESDVRSFTGRKDFTVCRKKSSEYLIFRNEIRCQEEYGTMQANAP